MREAPPPFCVGTFWLCLARLVQSKKAGKKVLEKGGGADVKTSVVACVDLLDWLAGRSL